MPELPEVETVVRALRPDLQGRRIEGARILWAGTLNQMGAESFAARVSGQRIESLERRGKFILLHLSEDDLLIHLRMTGRLYVAFLSQVLEDDRWLRLALPLDDGRELRFSDARKFGRVYLVAQAEEVIGGLGPEPLSGEFTLDVFAQQIAHRGGAIKSLLLRQSFVAGIGNIYADEALWAACIHPLRPADSLDDVEIAALYQAIREALALGISSEGASINWYRKPDGTTGSSQEHFKAYGRKGKPCPRCGAIIQRIVAGQRGTHFCPSCQKV